MNFPLLLTKSFTLVRIIFFSLSSFLIGTSIDWRVDGDPEHEIQAANPRVAEGALTMVSIALIERDQ